MSATLRGIDLTTQLMAPVATGQIMTYAKVTVGSVEISALAMGALFIAAWNMISVFLEYFLIWKVYQSVPALQKRKRTVNKHKGTCMCSE